MTDKITLSTFEPDIGYGKEPSLLNVLFRYYKLGDIPTEDSLQCAKQYIAEIEKHMNKEIKS